VNLDSRIYVAGHRGLVGSNIMTALERRGHTNLVLRTRAELDLLDAPAVRALFEAERPEYVFLAAGRVGGIAANAALPARRRVHAL
jgi:GDP-L-fucose synthase